MYLGVVESGCFQERDVIIVHFKGAQGKRELTVTATDLKKKYVFNP